MMMNKEQKEVIFIEQKLLEKSFNFVANFCEEGKRWGLIFLKFNNLTTAWRKIQIIKM
jgi:hypothetical protein